MPTNTLKPILDIAQQLDAGNTEFGGIPKLMAIDPAIVAQLILTIERMEADKVRVQKFNETQFDGEVQAGEKLFAAYKKLAGESG